MSLQTDMSEPRIYESMQHPPRPTFQAMGKGFCGKCPACGQGKMFRAYLKVADKCGNCGEELHHHQADDAPPYFTIMIVGHIVVPLMLWLELAYFPPMWIHIALWPTMTLVMSLLLLPRVKGAVVGWQWAFRMHGFGEEPDDNV